MKKTKNRNYLLVLLFIVITGSAAIFLVFTYLSRNLPPISELDNYSVGQSTKIYDRAGQTLIYEIYGEEKRTILPSEEIPDLIKKATVAIEDESFYSHPAFDVRGIARALLVNVLKGGVVQGGSTITQQLAKNSFLSPERSLLRKVKELILAYRIENLFSKDEILALYLNQVPYGQNSYGVEAGSRVYFNKPAKEMSLSEISLLAGLTKAPSYYSPWGAHAEELEKRRIYVLERMLELGFIDKEQFAAGSLKPQLMKEPQKTDFSLAPHFALMVQEYLNQKYGEDFVRRAGLKVTTTLDVELQKMANKAVEWGAKRNTELYDGRNAALVAEDATTGQILALVGSKGYSLPSEPMGCIEAKTCQFEGNFNVASQGLRQPGSAFKPLGYLTAFLEGLTPDTVLFDAPTEFAPNNPSCPSIVDFNNRLPECYHPKNFDSKFRGPISLKEALAQSRNVPSVKVLYLAGLDKTIDLAERFGITTLKDRGRLGLSLILGGGEVKLAELVNAYAVFAEEGIKHEQTFILKVEDADGKIWEEYREERERVVEEQYPRLINDILSDRNLRMPLYRASINLTEVPGRQVALKTGTTDDHVDAWALGYTPDLVAGVWIGNNNREPMKSEGSSILAAVPVWHNFMAAALANRPVRTFNKPALIPVSNPILRGELDRNNVHDILHYLNRLSDPQYKNWEEGVSAWLKENPLPAVISSPSYSYEADSQEEGGDVAPENMTINLASPKAGAFISQEIKITALLSSPSPINKIEVYFNSELVESKTGAFGQSYSYDLSFSPKTVKLQNLLVLRATNESGAQSAKEIIVFKE